ncbi:MAG: ADP-glyceromanno-heptose 6-epimerase [Parachlamydiales bacterium]|nr:ADP-glyceromanno-heptose 6-epimerase [Parachlamydiales bacterium]
MKQKQIFEDQYIVVTGAAGMIGSGVVRYLNDQGRAHLLLVDDLGDTDKWKNLVNKQFLEIISKEELFSFLEGRENEIEAFVHLGACTDTTEKDADYLLENNYRFTVRLAEYALTHEHRFIYASSAATYGNGSNGFTDSHDLLEKLRPLNMYGYSKHLFDLWAKKENVLDKIVGLKYFNVFGPNEYHKGSMSSMIYKMFRSIQKEGKIRLFRSNDPSFTDGEQKRDFIYVKDAVKMTCALLEDSFREISGIYNIGTGTPVSFNDVAELLFNITGKKKNIEYIPMPRDIEDKFQNYTCANMQKYFVQHNIVDPKAFLTPLEDAIKDYITQYLMEEKTW